MRTIATIQYKSEAAMMSDVYSLSIEEIEAKMGEKLPSGAYLYANERNQIEAAHVHHDATPSDEVEFIGRVA